jgi:hypothetical protein
MLRMRARTGRGTGVAVGSWATTGVTVSVGGWKGVGVTVETGAAVGAESGVETVDRPRTRGRQEVRSRSARRKVRVRFISKLSGNFIVIALHWIYVSVFWGREKYNACIKPGSMDWMRREEPGEALQADLKG